MINIGDKFDLLIVVAKDHIDEKRHVFWLCKCDCGNEKIVREDYLKANSTKSCGCLRFKNLSGNVFGRLKVTSEYKKEKRNKYSITKWLCKCSCGKEKWINSQDLISKHTQSCGCLQMETIRNRKLDYSRASQNKCYANYKKNAKSKNRKFDLSFEDFINLTQSDCYYCNVSPKNCQKSIGYNGSYVYNGIDRINSNEGYVISNCVPCCKKCNIAKHNMSKGEFLNLIRSIYVNRCREIIIPKCTVVAEACCNHMGDINIAKSMIKSAKECGSDYIKFQKRNPNDSVPLGMKEKSHPNPENSFGHNYLEHRNALEFTLEQHRELKKECENIGIKYACSVWDICSAKEIISLEPDYIKIPSAMNNDLELIDYVYNNFNKSVHISLGMISKEYQEFLIKRLSCYTDRTVFYWTTSGYPVKFEELFLLELRDLFDKNLQVGYSGHNLGIAIDISAYSLGAYWIERHFTLDRTWKGSDQAASLEPMGLKKLCRDLLATNNALSYKSSLTEDEIKNSKKLRRF